MCRWIRPIRWSGSPRCGCGERGLCVDLRYRRGGWSRGAPGAARRRSGCSGRCAEPVTDADRLAPLGVDTTAYVIFTSGSTGAPQGRRGSHAGLLGVAAAQRQVYGLSADTRMLMVASPTFDGRSRTPVGGRVGAAVVVAPPEGMPGRR